VRASEAIIDQTAKGGEDPRRGVPAAAIHVGQVSLQNPTRASAAQTELTKCQGEQLAPRACTIAS
jgi:hypothetical protein